MPILLNRHMAELRETLPPPESRDGHFCPELFLHSYSLCPNGEEGKKTCAVLDAISRKIEVGRALCVAYPSGMLGAPVDGTRVSPEYMVMACAVMLHAAKEYAEAAYLNCALKMLSGVAVPKADYPDWLHAAAKQLLAEPLARWRA